MAEKILNTRIRNKIDTLANWESSEAILFAGEIAFAKIDTASGNINDVPTVVIKVGDGTHKWSELKYVYAQASDVYAWAKKAQPDYNDLINKPAIPSIPVQSVALESTEDGTYTLKVNGVGTPLKMAGYDELVALVNGKADEEHTHTHDDITDFDTAVNALIAAGNFAVKGQIVDADISASAAIAQSKISGLTSALAGKAALEHDHVVADITDFGTAVDGKISTHNSSGTAHSDIRSAAQAAQTAADGAQDAADAAQAAAEAAQATANAAMPKAGGTFTGAVTFNAGVTVQAPTAEMNPATKQYVDNAVSAAASGSFEVVESYEDLPPTGDPGVIYLVPHTHGEGDSYDEYIYVNNAYEKIGNTDIDLSNYVNAVTGTANAGVVTNITKSGSTITVASQSLATADPTASGTTAVAIDTISQAANGKITATKKNIQITQSQVTGLDTALAGKADTSVTDGLDTRLDAAEASIGTIEGELDDKAPLEHTHEIADVTGLQAALNGKQDSNANLTAIAGLAATAGFVKRTASGFEVDTNDYQTQAEVESQITAHAGVDKVGTVTSVSTTVGGGLKVTDGTSAAVVDIDDTVVFVFDCGTATTNVDSIE